MESLAQSMRPQFESLRRAWRRSPLPGFLCWWRAELLACLPSRWRTVLTRGAQWRLLYPDAEAWQVREAGNATALARIDPSLPPAQQQAAVREACTGVDPQDLRLALCLPSRDVLRKRLRLPAAASTNLRQVIAYEMDRQTPFHATQVYFDTLEHVDAGSAGHIEVEMLAVPRQRLEPLLQRLQGAGIEIDAVDALDGDQRLGVNLLPPAQQRRHVHPRRRLNLVLGVLLLLLVLSCMLQWVHNRRTVVAAMQAHVDAMHAQARAVMKLRRELTAGADAAGFLTRRRAATPTVLAVLEDLSRRLPANTWLQRLTIGNDGLVGMQGQSPQAAHLVDLLKQSIVLSEPGFQGVIQTDPRTHKERFYLTAHLRSLKPADARHEKGGSHAAATH